jgi:hypothetical protein
MSDLQLLQARRGQSHPAPNRQRKCERDLREKIPIIAKPRAERLVSSSMRSARWYSLRAEMALSAEFREPAGESLIRFGRQVQSGASRRRGQLAGEPAQALLDDAHPTLRRKR